MRKIKRIVIHCAATPNGVDFHARDIDLWHKQKGWSSIGYHYVIPLSGKIEEGRPEDKIGAHARGYNSQSLGICLIGTSKFTRKQWMALRSLVLSLSEKYEVLKGNIVGHRDLPNVAKSCPGFSVTAWKALDMMPIVEHVLSEK